MDMETKIASVMKREVATADIDDTIEHVERILNDGAFSFVPVVEPHGKCFGVISASDLVHFHARQENPKLKRAWEVCTHQVIEVAPDASLREVACLMLNKHVHHVVIMESGHVAGILSSLDLIDRFVLAGEHC
jgi:signal-transduction protein with cAMP-binding, CBS, and nucleotidyltransferase domain